MENPYWAGATCFASHVSTRIDQFPDVDASCKLRPNTIRIDSASLTSLELTLAPPQLNRYLTGSTLQKQFAKSSFVFSFKVWKLLFGSLHTDHRVFPIQKTSRFGPTLSPPEKQPLKLRRFHRPNVPGLELRVPKTRIQRFLALE